MLFAGRCRTTSGTSLNHTRNTSKTYPVHIRVGVFAGGRGAGAPSAGSRAGRGGRRRYCGGCADRRACGPVGRVMRRLAGGVRAGRRFAVGDRAYSVALVVRLFRRVASRRSPVAGRRSPGESQDAGWTQAREHGGRGRSAWVGTASAGTLRVRRAGLARGSSPAAPTGGEGCGGR